MPPAKVIAEIQTSSPAPIGAANAKKRGAKLGNTTNLDVAQRKGAISNAVRADRKIQDLADFIERTSGWDKMTLRARVDLLNRSGPHNLISEKRDERRLWTMSSLRKPLKKAEAELDFRNDLETEPIDLARNRVLDLSQERNTATSDGDLETTNRPKDKLLEFIAYKDIPNFGRF